MSEETWHVIATLTDGLELREEAKPKPHAEEIARNVICDPRVDQVNVVRCLGEKCFDCGLLRAQAAAVR